jgi:hypothetical protein
MLLPSAPPPPPQYYLAATRLTCTGFGALQAFSLKTQPRSLQSSCVSLGPALLAAPCPPQHRAHRRANCYYRAMVTRLSFSPAIHWGASPSFHLARKVCAVDIGRFQYLFALPKPAACTHGSETRHLGCNHLLSTFSHYRIGGFSYCLYTASLRVCVFLFLFLFLLKQSTAFMTPCSRAPQRFMPLVD